MILIDGLLVCKIDYNLIINILAIIIIEQLLYQQPALKIILDLDNRKVIGASGVVLSSNMEVCWFVLDVEHICIEVCADT